MKQKLARLFVYGTLGPGRPNEHIMSKIGGTWQDATITGKFMQKGWGAEMGYPGIVLDLDGEKVKGFVFTSENILNHWAQLDEFEGEGYQREVTQATVEDGSIVDVYVYVLNNLKEHLS